MKVRFQTTIEIATGAGPILVDIACERAGVADGLELGAFDDVKRLIIESTLDCLDSPFYSGLGRVTEENLIYTFLRKIPNCISVTVRMPEVAT